MSDQSPIDLRITELIHADLARESAIGLIKHILRRDADILLCELADQEQVERGRGNDDFDGGIELGRVEVVDEIRQTLGGAVPGSQTEAMSVIVSWFSLHSPGQVDVK